MKTFGQGYLAALLTYARFDNRTERTITGIGATETAKGRFNSDLFGGRIELGWRHGMGRYMVTPFVAIEPTWLRQQGYTESSTTSTGGAGVLGLSYASHTTTSLPSFLGVQVDTRYALAGGQVLAPSARLSWVHEFKPDRQIEATLVNMGSGSFTVDGARAARDALRTDLGVTLALTPSSALFASLNGEFSDVSTTLAGTAGAKVTW
jgi:outer membrane autotransporter protein